MLLSVGYEFHVKFSMLDAKMKTFIINKLLLSSIALTTITNNLKLTQQCSEVVKKVNKIIGLLVEHSNISPKKQSLLYTVP